MWRLGEIITSAFFVYLTACVALSPTASVRTSVVARTVLRSRLGSSIASGPIALLDSRKEASASQFGGNALSVFERFGRASRFYQSAVPIFAAYKSLEQSVKFRREVLDQTVSAEEEETAYQALHEWGSDELVRRIKELGGFYVKTGQILSTRKDIFPEQYTEKLAIMQDKLDPLPGDLIKDVVRRELLDGAELGDLFSSFEDECLGSASIAQVHKAVLLDGRTVAVKVQRPGVEPKLLGDIANLKYFAKIVADALPIDYYKIFCELERTLNYELDFLHESQATAKMAAAVAHAPNNTPRKGGPPVTIPLPIPGLVSRRVMVMEYIEGIPLSRIAAEMAAKGIKAGSPESILLGKRLLSSLTDAYSAMIFGSGILHGDPHPGNVFILEGGNVCLLDCGQVKQLTTPQRMGLANLVIQVNDWENDDTLLRNLEKSSTQTAENTGSVRDRLAARTHKLAETVRGFGVTFKPGAGDDCAAAVAILLFGNTDTVLPGGYAGEEISPESPIVQVTEFPQELVLLGRATVMIKGISARLGLKWGLSDRWAAVCRELLDPEISPVERMPIWSVVRPSVATPGAVAPDGRQVSGAVPVKLKDIVISVRALLGLVSGYVQAKTVVMYRRAIPPSVRGWFLRSAVKIVAGVSKILG